MPAAGHRALVPVVRQSMPAALNFSQLATNSAQLLGSLDAGLLVGFLVVVDAPLIIGVGNAPLLAVDGHRGGGGLELVVEAIGLPDIVDRLEQAGLDEGRHAVAGIPGRHVRRIGGQEVADGGLVALVVEVVPLHRDVGVLGLEVGDQFLHRLLRRRIGLVGIDHQFAGERGRNGQGKAEGEPGEALENGHVVPPIGRSHHGGGGSARARLLLFPVRVYGLTMRCKTVRFYRRYCSDFRFSKVVRSHGEASGPRLSRRERARPARRPSAAIRWSSLAIIASAPARPASCSA